MPSLYITSSVHTDGLISSTVSKPLYYIDRPRWLLQVSDKSLAILAPILTYWSIFLLYRFFLLVHFPPAARRRRTRKSQAIRLIVEIQIVQTLFGWVWITRFGQGREWHEDVTQEMKAVARVLGAVLTYLMGTSNAQEFMTRHGEGLVQFAYWWGIPVARQLFASFIIDVWHGLLFLCHIDHYLYADVHAFLFDTVGVSLAYSLSGITNRETAVFLALSTLQSFGKRPRPTLPSSSIHPRIPLDRELSAKPAENVPFMGFRRQLYHILLVHWYVLLGEARLDMHAIESRRIQRAMHAARHQQATNQKGTRPQLRLDMSCLR